MNKITKLNVRIQSLIDDVQYSDDGEFKAEDICKQISAYLLKRGVDLNFRSDVDLSFHERECLAQVGLELLEHFEPPLPKMSPVQLRKHRRKVKEQAIRDQLQLKQAISLLTDLVESSLNDGSKRPIIEEIRKLLS